VRRPARRRDRLLGWGLTGLLALAGLAAGGALLVGLVLFVVAMPLTSAVIAAVLLWGGWRMVAQRRRARR
jgi:Flp pilus assembly protein TadB